MVLAEYNCWIIWISSAKVVVTVALSREFIQPFIDLADIVLNSKVNG